MDADRVDAAPEAYSRMWLPMPDAMLGLLSYAITAVLGSLGGAARYDRLWWLVLLLFVKVLADAYQAGKLSWEQWSLHQAFCFWCLAAAMVELRDEAVELFERLLSVRNDVGLLSEEYDPDAKRLLGNFPQAFSHVGLVNSARNLAAREGPAEHRPKG